MKTYCKNIDITNRSLIRKAVFDCIDGKYTRKDVLQMLSQYSGVEPYFIKKLYKSLGKTALIPLIETVVDGIREELINQKIIIKPIWYKFKVDASSHKVRRVGIQDIKQQIYDYIAVIALEPFIKRIGEFQCASIEGRGQIQGAAKIKKWLRNKSIKYYGKSDIRKCYPNISHRKIMRFMEKYIKNELLLWLIKTLIDTFEEGLSIGSYLSQFLCNLYLSQLYHEISENFYTIRKHKNGTIERVRLISHVIFYMDDILILGTNLKYIKKAMKMIIKYTHDELGLEIKDDWVVCKIRETDRNKDADFVDMMGYRVYRHHITIRRTTFLRIRKAYMKALKLIQLHKPIPIKLARKCSSYYGIIKHSDSLKFRTKYKVSKVLKICKKVVSNYDGKIYGKAITC